MSDDSDSDSNKNRDAQEVTSDFKFGDQPATSEARTLEWSESTVQHTRSEAKIGSQVDADLLASSDLHASRYSMVNLPRSSNFKIEVRGPFRKTDSLLMIGHYEFTLQVTKNQDVCSVDRRYSDFDQLRRAIACVFPGLFIAPLPPKDMTMSFQKEDSDSV